VERLVDYARKSIPIIGVEPSCITCFRDEYPDLLNSGAARKVAEQSFFFEEFMVQPMQQKRLQDLLPANAPSQKILLHTHCYQKAMGTASHVVTMLRLLPHTQVEEIACGCCGMAGSFGYEKEHYDISMAIGEQVLFPTIRAAAPDTQIVAAGTSCRDQIKDGTQRHARHPIEILAEGIFG
jgi:Fe-S oxidoreductase